MPSDATVTYKYYTRNGEDSFNSFVKKGNYISFFQNQKQLDAYLSQYVSERSRPYRMPEEVKPLIVRKFLIGGAWTMCVIT